MNVFPKSDIPETAGGLYAPAGGEVVPAPQDYSGEPWKILMVDDDPDIHMITQAVLKKIIFQGRGLEFISAYSSADAQVFLAQHRDIAVILLDVVMETEHAGLDLVHYIRDTLANSLSRIILRTGQAGTIPERSVILDYDINDYREKSDLTATRLFTSVVAALRAYSDMQALDLNRRRMKCLAETAGQLHRARSHDEVFCIALSRIAQMWGLCSSPSSLPLSGVGAYRVGQHFQILAAVGEWQGRVGDDLAAAFNEEDYRLALSLVGCTAPLTIGKSFGFWFSVAGLAEFLIYLRVENGHSVLDKEAFQVLLDSIATALERQALDHEIESAQREVILTICEVVETRSKETGNHVHRVGELSALLATLQGLPTEEVELLRLSASLHDLGKLGIADHILNKPGRFTAEEFLEMQEHCRIGHRILSHSRRHFLQDAAIVALQHHEKWNGSGYPAGLAGEAIHLHGRIVAVADVFDALRNARPYKQPWSLEQVVDYFRQQRGEHFDPHLVDLLLANLDAASAIQGRFPE